MTERLTDEIIWDTRKPIPVKKFEGDPRIPCIVQLVRNNSLDQTKHLTELAASQALLLHSIVSHKKIICRCAVTDDLDTSNEAHQNYFTIPMGYNGLVELLSENGEASPPLSLISEIAEVAAEKFLIRSKIEGLAEITDKTSTRLLNRGTVLTVKGTARVTSRRGTESYLHCTDKSGFYVYLNYNTSGVFSPFAGPKNISGVHSINSLLKGFRLPCTVRVVSGKIPRQACDSDRPGVFRLLEIRKEKTAMISPISSKQTLIPLSLKTDISFYRPGNMKELSCNHIFRQIYDMCTHKVEQFLTAMQVIVSKQTNKTFEGMSREAEDRLFEDVDEIYPYIRKGGVPPRMTRAQSLDNEILTKQINSANIYGRSSSQPAIGSRERSSSLIVSQVVKQHTISSAKTETTFQFQSTSDSLTLGRTDVLRQFIQKYTSKESLTSRSSPDQSIGSSDNEIYHTLDNDPSEKPSQVKDILLPHGKPVANRG